MTTKEEVLANAPAGLTVDLIAGLIDKSIGVQSGRVARDILRLLAGEDDEPGPLDRYDVKTHIMEGGKPLIIWYCPVCHHVGIIARDMDGDQTNLTLGEILQAVLNHEAEAHA